MSNSKQVNFKLSNPVHFLALGFGSGLIKPAPGTWGTLASVPLYLLTIKLFPTTTALIVITLLMFVIGIYLCGKTADDVGVHDHGAIVWDEFVGFFITMIAVAPTLPAIVIGFLLFRFFDIVKPWPIGVIDKQVQGGFGIMLDDVIAGIMACAVLHVIVYVLAMV